MTYGYTRRIRQSGWIDVAAFLLLISLILFFVGSVWQEQEIEPSIPILNEYGEYEEPEIEIASYRPAFEIYGIIALTLAVFSLISAVLSPWFHQTVGRVKHGRRFVALLRFLLCLFVLAIMAFPIYWMILTSLMTSEELLQEIPVFLPSKLSFENYSAMLRNAPFGRYVFNTFLTSGFILLGEVTIGTLAAYGFSKGHFKGKNILFGVVLGAIVIPKQALYVPLYTFALDMNWVNTYSGIILPNLVSGFFIFLLRQAFLSVDESFIDAAKLDGMGRIRSITHVLIPMCKPTFVAACVFTLTREWNSFVWPKIITTNENRQTIALGIQNLLKTIGEETAFPYVNYNEVMAGVVLAVLPIALLLFVFRRHLAMDDEAPPIR